VAHQKVQTESYLADGHWNLNCSDPVQHVVTHVCVYVCACVRACVCVYVCVCTHAQRFAGALTLSNTS